MRETKSLLQRSIARIRRIFSHSCLPPPLLPHPQYVVSVWACSCCSGPSRLSILGVPCCLSCRPGLVRPSLLPPPPLSLRPPLSLGSSFSIGVWAVELPPGVEAPAILAASVCDTLDTQSSERPLVIGCSRNKNKIFVHTHIFVCA